MKRSLIIVLLLIFATDFVQGQYVLKNMDDVTWYINIPQEEIYVHHNSSFLLAGERLLYTAYCLNATTKEYSKNSKIAYVELVGKEGVLFTHKIKLENGTGQGDFFIPTNLKSGRYKLIAYTRWMTNGSIDDYFVEEITIVNPYAKIEFNESASMEDRSIRKDTPPTENLDIKTDASIYGKRKPVQIKIIGNGLTNLGGNYSVSVRKFDEILNESVTSANEFSESLKDTRVSLPRKIGESIYLPEFKGEMITGMVKDKSSGKPIEGMEVALSILSKEAHQDIVKTNEEGIFYFQLIDNYSTPKAMVQVLDDDLSNYDLSVTSFRSQDYSKFKFDEVSLNPSQKNMVIERSVHNQVENAYAKVKQDKQIGVEYAKVFYGNPIKTYELDDYKRFPTIAKTLDEVVDHAYHERKKGKKRYINVRERETDPYYDVDILPLIIVDGAAIQDHESVLYQDADLVKSISVLRDEYYYDKTVYQGVLMIKTFDGDYYKNFKGDHFKVFDLINLQPRKVYFSPDHSTNEAINERVPDFRRQLYWNPSVTLQQGRKDLTFYTSDIEGTYEITLEGFNADGVPMTFKKYFNVE